MHFRMQSSLHENDLAKDMPWRVRENAEGKEERFLRGFHRLTRINKVLLKSVKICEIRVKVFSPSS